MYNKVGVSVLMNCGGEITRRDSACSFSVSLTASNCRLNCMIDACQLITNYLSIPIAAYYTSGSSAVNFPAEAIRRQCGKASHMDSYQKMD
jgi:hypothetical protein